jgi:hypothetical protein
MPPRKRQPAIEAATDGIEAAAATTTTETAVSELESRPVDLFGRPVRVRRPTAEHIAVWQRLAKQWAALGSGAMSNGDAMALLDRAMRIVETILADRADWEWLMDQMLEGVLKLDQVVGIVGLTVDAYRNDAAEAAPATGPAPKARRR